MAAVSIRQYETAAKSLSVYSPTIETGLPMLLRNSDDESTTTEARQNRTGAIVFGSDQGMCGQFNEQISEFAFDYLQQNSCDIAPMICVGHRVAEKLTQHGLQSDEVVCLPGSASGITRLVQELLPIIDKWRDTHRINRILVFHNRRLTASTWRPFVLQLLPLKLERLQHCDFPGNPGRSLPLWTMETSALFSRLVKQFLFVSLFRAFAESLAGESARRIAAMQSAERNIKDRLHLLRSGCAQQRPTTIAEELLDVVTVFEELEESEFVWPRGLVWTRSQCHFTNRIGLA